MDMTMMLARLLPETLQGKLLERRLRDGSAFASPVFAMLLRSLETFGGRGRSSRPPSASLEREAGLELEARSCAAHFRGRYWQAWPRG